MVRGCYFNRKNCFRVVDFIYSHSCFDSALVNLCLWLSAKQLLSEYTRTHPFRPLCVLRAFSAGMVYLFIYSHLSFCQSEAIKKHGISLSSIQHRQHEPKNRQHPKLNSRPAFLCVVLRRPQLFAYTRFGHTHKHICTSTCMRLTKAKARALLEHSNILTV